MISFTINPKKSLFTILLTLMQCYVFAVNYTLTSGGFSELNWFNPTIWSPNGVPGPNDEVTINVGENAFLTIEGDVTVKSLTVNRLAYIYGAGTLTVIEKLHTKNALGWQKKLVIAAGANALMTDELASSDSMFTKIYFYADLLVNGNLTLESKGFVGSNIYVKGSLTQKEGSLLGNYVIDEGGVLNIESPNIQVDLGNIDNFGTVNWRQGNIASQTGYFKNVGTWNLFSTNSSFTYNFNGIFQGSTINNLGNIQVASNVKNVNIAVNMINDGNINLLGNTLFSILGFNHSGSIIGNPQSVLQISGIYFDELNTFQDGSVVNVGKLITTENTSLNIKSGANIGTIRQFEFGNGPIQLDLKLPSDATYLISAQIRTNVDQLFTGECTMTGAYFEGICNISFDTPNLNIINGGFGNNIKVLLSAATVLEVKDLSVTDMTNNGVINTANNSFIGIGFPGIINNNIINFNGTTSYVSGNNVPVNFPVLLNVGVFNVNSPTIGFNTVLDNRGTIQLGKDVLMEVTVKLIQSNVLNGSEGCRLSLGYSYEGHEFNAGATTSDFDIIEVFSISNLILKQGTVLNNIGTISVKDASLTAGIILPPNTNYIFENANIRLNTIFQPNTVLNMTDTDIEGSGNIRISNQLIWNGGIMDVPVKINENATAWIKEKQKRPIISAPFTNEGDITLSGGIIEINTGFFKNGGNWNVDSDEDVIIDGFTAFTNQGIFSICGEQPIKIAFNVPFINGSSGTFKGQGSYIFNAGFSNEGNLAPGCSPGKLVIEDNLEAFKALEMEIEGDGESQYDQLIVNGDMTAGKTLRLIVPDGTTVNGDLKIIQTSGSFSGTFEEVILPSNFTFRYEADGVIVSSNGTVNTNDAFKDEISVSPTLASTFIEVKSLSQLPANTILEIFDTHGRLRFTTSMDNLTIQNVDVSSLNEGMYILRMNTIPAWTSKVMVIR